MKKWMMLLALAVIGVATWFIFVTRKKPDNELTPRQQPLAVSRHSATFNESVNNALEAYYGLSEALVNWDSAAADSRAGDLDRRLEAIQLEELRKDTAGIFESAEGSLSNVRNDAQAFGKQAGLTEKRRRFHQLSNNLYDFLRVIRYDAAGVYLQQCPMAFNDDETAQWISASAADEARRNPYLGVKDPKYGRGMLACGETIDSLRFQ
ncbi:MAG TPA: DUF3347 domain-containing protein [Chitinophagaceae bacterium]|jgi:hypothetical protein|nr:DUF3347 domain-containing protein [Chitinophagaceae bacterium]